LGLPVVNLITPQAAENSISPVVHFDVLYTDPSTYVHPAVKLLASSILFEIDRVNTFDSGNLIEVTYVNIASGTRAEQ
jgi:hypothetical protein